MLEMNSPGVDIDPLEICNPEQINELLREGAEARPDEVRDLIQSAASLNGLQPCEVAILIQVTDKDLRREILAAAQALHEQGFGRRVRLSAPVCPSNVCINDCLYCPLRRSNARLRRRPSNDREVQREAVALLDEGHKHFGLVFGDDGSGVSYVRQMITATLGVHSGLRQVRRLDLNLNALNTYDLQQMHPGSRLGTYHVFQETYHRPTYTLLHPDGPKADYDWRLTCHHKAFQAGLREVGLGLLLGAYDFRFDVVALIGHLRHLYTSYSQMVHAITYPRMVPAAQAPASQDPERQISDEDFLFIVAVTRLAAPRTEIVQCTPTTSGTRRQLYAVGISEVSAGSSSYPGVYTSGGNPRSAGLLTIGRPRALEELVYRMCEGGFVPNFSVAHAHERPTQGLQPYSRQFSDAHARTVNALLALKEYLMDYASPATREIGERLINSQLAKLPAAEREVTLELMEEAEAGLRDQML